jgi:probable HAF family extracellular repeat protein
MGVGGALLKPLSVKLALRYAEGHGNAPNFPGAHARRDAARDALAAFGINDHGQVVGDYIDANGQQHGFLATPVR